MMLKVDFDMLKNVDGKNVQEQEKSGFVDLKEEREELTRKAMKKVQQLCRRKKKVND